MKFYLYIYYYQASFVREKGTVATCGFYFYFSVNSKPNLLRIHADRLKTDIWQQLVKCEVRKVEAFVGCVFY